MVHRNPHLAKLKAGYLFPEVARRVELLRAEQPDAHFISLGIGDTSEPIPTSIAQRMAQFAQDLGSREGYTGYGPGQGLPLLREKIASTLYEDRISPNDIFVNDGAKCDLARLLQLFGPQATIGIQDPAYPAYVDGSVLTGMTGEYNAETQHYDKITYIPCTPENDFFPDLESFTRPDLLVLCSPNNPTGAVCSFEQLEYVVRYAQKHKTILIFDSAYAAFIQDPQLPRSIYEVPGAEEVAIEVGSFSKLAGFTGVRLGWTIVPEALRFSDGHPVKQDWVRLISTVFNGASNIAQWGGIACLEQEGQRALQELVQHYLDNTALLRHAMEEKGIPVYGGTDTPYIWAHFPGRKSWEVFDAFLRQKHLITTPGSGFGPSGESFLRLSAFGRREDIQEAARRILES